MQNLGNVMKSAEISKSPVDVALGQFLRAYRETPHSTTGVPPEILMLGSSRTTGIPQFLPTGDEMREAQASAHHKASTNDERQKKTMRAEYDLNMHTRNSRLQVGSLVVVQRPITNKSVTTWDPNPYRGVSIKGSMVTAQRQGTT
jgi:hypothetical protein